ncbi:MAG: Ppx/GppA phosphatase family protein, partial [Sphingomonadales bacterium]
HLKNNNWPVPILHNYQIPRDEIQNFTNTISKKSVEALNEDFSIKNRRLPLIPAGAYILKTVLKNISSSEAICSSQGIREGIYFKKLNHKIKKKDPFIEACKEIADKTGGFSEHAYILFSWMKPLFEKESNENLRLCFGCCLLSDISLHGHSDFKAKIAFENSFYGQFFSLDHRSRAIVSIALYLSYRGQFIGKNVQSISKILPKKSIEFSKILGSALRLGQKLTGGSSKPLEYTSLNLDHKHLTLNIPFDHKALGGESIESRLKDLAKSLGVQPLLQIMKKN